MRRLWIIALMLASPAQPQRDPCGGADETPARLRALRLDAERPLWHHYTFDTGSHNREELEIVEVAIDKELQLEYPVSQWTSLKNRAAGLGERGLTLVAYLPGGVVAKHYDMDERPASACLFEWWDADEAALRPGLLLARGAAVDWHLIDDGNALRKMWEWNLNARIFHLSAYRLNGNWKVAVTHERSGEKSRVVSVYGADPWKEWWFEERLDGHGAVTVVNDGRYLAVPLEDGATVAVYKYDSVSGRHVLYKSTTSANVKSVEAFVVGANSFLAVGGESPVVYEIRGGDFVEKSVDQYDVRHVEFFAAVPLGHYRDEAALLFQHRLDHYSHSSSALEALRWDGVRFAPMEHSPCRSRGEEAFGFACVLDADDEKGIEGVAAVLGPDDVPRLLTASDEYAPVAFAVRARLVDAPDPLDVELERVLEAQAAIVRRAVRERAILEKAEALKNAGAGAIRIEEIRTPSLRVSGDIAETLSSGGRLRVAGEDHSGDDRASDLDALLSGVEARSVALADALGRLKSAAMRDEGPLDAFDVAAVFGGLVAMKTVTVEKASVETLNGLPADAALSGAAKRTSDELAAGTVVVDELDLEDVRVDAIDGTTFPLADGAPAVADGDLRVEGHVHVLKDVVLAEGGTVNGARPQDAVVSRGPDARAENANAAPLLLDGAAIEGTLTVEGALNGFDFSERGFAQALREKRRLDAERSLDRSDMNLDSATVDDLQFDEVGGRSWREFVAEAVLRDEDVELGELDADGGTLAGGELALDALNDLRFPELYLRTSESSPAAVIAPKRLAGGARADGVDCEGAVSGVPPRSAVTLSSQQTLDDFTFSDLTVTERVNVRGDVAGRELDAFLANPRLSETNSVRSNCVFRRLRVVGTASVLGKANGSEWGALFDGVAVRAAEPVRVDALKAFEGRVAVERGAAVRSGFAGERRVADFLAADGDQAVSNGILAGDISFDDLAVGGAFDGVDVADLAGRAVGIAGDRARASDVTFDRSGPPTTTPRLRVQRRCNGWTAEDLPRARSASLEAPRFSKLRVERGAVAGDLRVDGGPLATGLSGFERSRASATEARTAAAPFISGEVRAESLSFGRINGASERLLRELARKATTTGEERRAASAEDAATLRARGALHAAEVCGVDLMRAAETAVPIRGSDVSSGRLRFFDRPAAESVREEDGRLERMAADVVRVDDEPVQIRGGKRYLRGLGVAGNAEFSLGADALTRSGDQALEGNARVAGSARFDGGVDSPRLLEREGATGVRREGPREYRTEGNARFPNAARVDRLNAATLTDPLRADFGSVSFERPVFVGGDLTATTRFAGFDAAIIEEAARNDGDFSAADAVFAAPPIIEGGALRVSGDLACARVLDCSPDEWRGAVEGASDTKNGDKRFESAVTAGDVAVADLEGFAERDDDRDRVGAAAFHSLTAERAVDAAAVEGAPDLEATLAGRLRRDGDQTLDGALDMNAGADVRRGRFGGRVGSAILVDATELVATAVEIRGSAHLEGALTTPGGAVSGLDLAEWARGASSAGEWRVSGDAAFEGGVAGEGRLDGRPPSELAGLAEERRRSLSFRQAAISEAETATRRKTSAAGARPPAALLRLGADAFLVASAADLECHARTWRRSADGRWTAGKPARAGCPAEWESLGDGAAASSDRADCGCSAQPGVVVWTFDGVDLQAIRTLPPAKSICASAKEEGVLYVEPPSGAVRKYRISKTDAQLEESESTAEEWKRCREDKAANRASLQSGEARAISDETAGIEMLLSIGADDRIELLPL